MSNIESLINSAWEASLGGLGWLRSVLIGEFEDNRPLSAIVADMLVSFIPGVVIVTSARDAVAIIVRLAQNPRRREEPTEWMLLCACMITLALPLALAAGGAVAAGVGAVVGGIAGSELGAALRAVILLLLKEATKLIDVIRFLQRFIKGDVIGFLRAVSFVKYEKALLMTFKRTSGKLIDICKDMRGKLSHLDYFDDVKRLVIILSEWERKFYELQAVAIKQIPAALAELDVRVAKLLQHFAPKESHIAVAGVEAHPAAASLEKQRVADVAGRPLLSSSVSSEKAVSQRGAASGARGAGASPHLEPKTAAVDKPRSGKAAVEGPNTRRQDIIELDPEKTQGSGRIRQSAWHATGTPGAAKNILQTGIDPNFLNPESRFGKAFHVAEEPDTALAEMAHYGVNPTTGLRYEINAEHMKTLDLTDPEVASRWGYFGGDKSDATRAIGAKASAEGYNAIRFFSERADGGVNIAVLNNFNKILEPVMVMPGTP